MGKWEKLQFGKKLIHRNVRRLGNTMSQLLQNVLLALGLKWCHHFKSESKPLI